MVRGTGQIGRALIDVKWRATSRPEANTLRKSAFGCHSERSEESAFRATTEKKVDSSSAAEDS
jgi:hypothetical protein